MVIDIQLLGGFRVLVDNRLVQRLTGKRSQSLVACLVLQANRLPLPRGYLAGQLWPESSEQQARTNLRREMHKLRQNHTGLARAIRADQNTLSWAPSVRCNIDVDCLREQSSRISATNSVAKRLLMATELVTLYKGHLLPGVTDHWVLEPREEILRTYLAACQQLGHLLRTAGEFGAAASLFEAAVAQDPLNEAVWLALMQLYLACDDRARSVKTYHQCARILQRELGVEPGEPLRRLYQNLTEGTSRATTQTDHRRSIQTSALSLATLIGRQRQQTELEASWCEVKSKGIKLVVIQGEAGIGKTYLAEAFLERLQDAGTAIAKSRAYAAEGSLPFAPIKDWLMAEPLVKAGQALTESAYQSIRQVFPDIWADSSSSVIDTIKAKQTFDSDKNLQRLALFEAMADAITSTQEPLVLFLDDLQWCDHDTLQWIRFLHRHAPLYPVMLLTTVRSEALVRQHPVTALINELNADGQTASIGVDPLDEAESRDLINYAQQTTETDTPFSVETIKRILARAEGNPLFIVELIRATLSARHTSSSDSSDLEPPFTERLYAVIQYRLSGLSEDAQQVAHLAATIGRQFTDELLMTAGGPDESAVVDVLDELWQRKLVRINTSGDYVFDHDYIREAIYAQMSPPRRRKLHLQIVDRLKEIHKDDIEPVTGELAVHCERAGLISEAVQWYQKSAQLLQSQFAFSEAIDNLEKGLTLFGCRRGARLNSDHQAELLISLGHCEQVLAGFASPKMFEICQRMRKLMPQIKSLGLKIDVLERIRRYYGNIDVVEAIRLSKEQVALANELGNDIKALSAYRSLGFSCYQLGEQVTADATMAQAQKIVARTIRANKRTAASLHYEIPLCMGFFTCVVAMRAHMNKSQKIGAESRAYPIEHLSVVPQVFIQHFRMQHAMLHRDPWLALENAGLVADVAVKYDYPWARSVSHYYSGWAHAVLDDHERAIDELTRAITGFESRHITMFMPQRWAILAGSQLAIGKTDDAQDSLNEAFAVARSTNQPCWDAELHRLTAHLLRARDDDPERIQTALSTAVTIAKRQGAGLLLLRASLDQARFLVDIDQTAKARRLLKEALEKQSPLGGCFELSAIVSLLTQLSPETAQLD